MQTPQSARFLFERSRRSFPVVLLLSMSAIAAGSLSVGGCSGGGAAGGTTNATPSPSATPTTTASPTPSPTPTPMPTPTPAATVVSVMPASVTLNVNAGTNFAASITGLDASQAALAWSVQESGGGTITTDGVYSAPAVPGTYHIIATSQTASTPAGVATVVVQAGDATGVIQ